MEKRVADIMGLARLIQGVQGFIDALRCYGPRIILVEFAFGVSGAIALGVLTLVRAVRSIVFI